MAEDRIKLTEPTPAYGDSWDDKVVIPAGSRPLVIDRVADERGACVIVLWRGRELMIDVLDLCKENA